MSSHPSTASGLAVLSARNGGWGGISSYQEEEQRNYNVIVSLA